MKSHLFSTQILIHDDSKAKNYIRIKKPLLHNFCDNFCMNMFLTNNKFNNQVIIKNSKLWYRHHTISSIGLDDVNVFPWIC